MIGRTLNQFVQAVRSGRNAQGFSVENAKTLIRVCDVLRGHVKSLIRANLASWESGHAE